MFPSRFSRPRVKVRDNVNEGIRAREVRAVFPDGSVQIMATYDAIRRAQELGLDLIVVSPTAEPPYPATPEAVVQKLYTLFERAKVHEMIFSNWLKSSFGKVVIPATLRMKIKQN